jgi:hypothetical protein
MKTYFRIQIGCKFNKIYASILSSMTSLIFIFRILFCFINNLEVIRIHNASHDNCSSQAASFALLTLQLRCVLFILINKSFFLCTISIKS